MPTYSDKKSSEIINNLLASSVIWGISLTLFHVSKDSSKGFLEQGASWSLLEQGVPVPKFIIKHVPLMYNWK